MPINVFSVIKSIATMPKPKSEPVQPTTHHSPSFSSSGIPPVRMALM